MKKVDFGYIATSAMEKVDKLVKLFRIEFKPSVNDREVVRVGFENKEKMFKYLLIAFEELNLMHEI